MHATSGLGLDVPHELPPVRQGGRVGHDGGHAGSAPPHHDIPVVRQPQLQIQALQLSADQ